VSKDAASGVVGGVSRARTVYNNWDPSMKAVPLPKSSL